MGTIHLTQKLTKLLGPKFLEPHISAIDSEDSVLGPWTAKPINLSRLKCVFFINDKTHLTVLCPYSPKEALFFRFSERLFKLLLRIGIKPDLCAHEASQYEKVKIDNKTDRSVLGSLTDLEYYYYAILQGQYDAEKQLDFAEAELKASLYLQVKLKPDRPQDYARLEFEKYRDVFK